MAAEERLSSSLQESILTALCFDDGPGTVIAGLVTPDLFEEPYRGIADRALNYRKRFGAAPGRAHIDDLFDAILEDPKNVKGPTYKRLLSGMLAQAEGLNAEFVLTRISEFVRRQRLKATVQRAADRYQQGGDDLSDDVAKILFDGLKFRVDSLDPGVFFGDQNRSLRFLSRERHDAYKMGIPELDRVEMGPTRKEMLLVCGARGAGKTWGLIHVGKQAMLQRGRVAHLSLEMSEEKICQRYYQSLYAIPKRDDETLTQTFFDLTKDKHQRLAGFRRETVKPAVVLSDPDIRDRLAEMSSEWGLRLNRLLIKQFPMRRLTMPQLEAWLDGIELVHHFVPDVLIIDYPAIMTIPIDNFRLALGRLFEDIRGLLVERNIAGVVAHQLTRGAGSSTNPSESLLSEDISILGTADNCLMYLQTKQEAILNLARLYAAKVRNDEAGFQVLVSQLYKTGQFVVDSTRMSMGYWDDLDAKTGTMVGEESNDRSPRR